MMVKLYSLKFLGIHWVIKSSFWLRCVKKSLSKVKQLENLPNIGKSISADLRKIGIERPDQLKFREPLEIFNELANVMGHRHDPCVLDVLISAKKFLNGEPAQPWWNYTDERRSLLAHQVKREHQ
jgi:hypothetical protein